MTVVSINSFVNVSFATCKCQLEAISALWYYYYNVSRDKILFHIFHVECWSCLSEGMLVRCPKMSQIHCVSDT